MNKIPIYNFYFFKLSEALTEKQIHNIFLLA